MLRVSGDSCMVFSFCSVSGGNASGFLSGIERRAQAHHDVVFFFQGFFS
jgi:hypothetical protein